MIATAFIRPADAVTPAVPGTVDDDTIGFTPVLVAGAAAAGFVTGVATVATGIALGVAIGTVINNSSSGQSAPAQGNQGGGGRCK